MNVVIIIITCKDHSLDLQMSNVLGQKGYQTTSGNVFLSNE